MSSSSFARPSPLSRPWIRAFPVVAETTAPGLNDTWRVAEDPPQWALQSRDGKQREKASGWAGRKFIRNRDHLIQRIDELCGNVDQQAIEIIRAWPVGYVKWKLMEMKADDEGFEPTIRSSIISFKSLNSLMNSGQPKRPRI